MKTDTSLEAILVEKYATISAELNERGRRLWAATESRAIGYGGDTLVSRATGLDRKTIRKGRHEIENGIEITSRLRKAGGGRQSLEKSQPGIM